MSKVANSNYFIFIQGMKSRPKYLLGKALELISPWCVLQEGTQVIHTREAVCSNTCGPSDTNKKMERAPTPPPLTARVELTSVHCDPKYHFLERERDDPHGFHLMKYQPSRFYMYD